MSPDSFAISEGAIVREPAKLLQSLLVPDVAAVAPDVGMIIAAYKERFDQQERAWQAEQPVCVAFE